MGDITSISTTIFITMYLHELLYISSELQLLSVLHHLGAVMVAGGMVSSNVRWDVEPNTTAYTVLIMTYGSYHPLQKKVVILTAFISRFRRRHRWVDSSRHDHSNHISREAPHAYVVLSRRCNSDCLRYDGFDRGRVLSICEEL